MSLISKLFGSQRSVPPVSLSPDADFCSSCGEEADPEEMDEGMCEDCQGTGSWPNYCCGMIYEDGESACMSCGEAL